MTHIIVCGLGRTGYKIFCLLRQQGAFVIGISDSRSERLCQRPLPDEGDIVIGDLQAASTLIAAGIQDAHTLVLAGSDEALNLAVLMQARVLNPQIRIINRLFNTSLGDRLDGTLPDHVTMSVAALTAPVFSFAALGSQAIGQLKLFDQTWPIHQEYIDQAHPWRGRKLRDLWDDRARMLIYYLPINHQVDLVSAVVQSATLEVGDYLIIGTKPSVQTAQKSLIQKLTKFTTNLKHLQTQSQALLGGTLLLLLTILATSLTYTSSVLQASLIDALYFSVGIITGAGGNDIGIAQAPADLKLFTVITMLVGAAIVGIAYALLTDFVLGTRFDQFWDTVRIPGHNHFVICGLGGVGVQIANQLHRCGYEVVVIEPDPNCRFLGTVRSLKIPVVQGDASLPATLKAANVDRAKAVLAVTSNDIANLEIALNAKGLTSKVALIVRYQDPDFAKMAQQVFEFEAVLSPAKLAAPAFAAAALGGRILGNGMTANSLWVALATLITPGHPFCGQCVKQAAMTADFVPLYVETSSQAIHGWDLLDTCLNAGDVLYLTMPASKLEQLWRICPHNLLLTDELTQPTV